MTPARDDQDRPGNVAPLRDEWLHLGKLTGPWGTRGEIKVHLDADLAVVKRLQRVYLGAEREPYDVLGFRARGRTHSFTLRGVATMHAAEALRGRDVSIPRAEAPDLPADTYFHDDVIGLRAVTTDGRALGVVTSIIVTGANDVYVVRSDDGSEILVPAIRDVVVAVDPQAGLLRVEPMPGLLPDS